MEELPDEGAQRVVRLAGPSVVLGCREVGLREVLDGVLARLQDLGQHWAVGGLEGHAPEEQALQGRHDRGVGEVVVG